MLGISVFHALRDAVAACGDGRLCELDAPATPERVLLAITARALGGGAARGSGRLMPAWLDALRGAGAGGRALRCWSRVLAARGSTPREAGCKMVVTADAAHGTIGGGNLEFQSLIARARTCWPGRLTRRW